MARLEAVRPAAQRHGDLMRDRINGALKDAMLAKDKLRTSTLRLMIAAIKDRDIALRAEEVSGGGGGLRSLVRGLVCLSR